MSDTNIITTIDDLSYDGSKYTVYRTSLKTDITLSNTEGPLHLGTLMKILGMDEIPPLTDEELKDNNKVKDHLHLIRSTWDNITSKFKSIPGTTGGFQKGPINVVALPINIVPRRKYSRVLSSFQSFTPPINNRLSQLSGDEASDDNDDFSVKSLDSTNMIRYDIVIYVNNYIKEKKGQKGLEGRSISKLATSICYEGTFPSRGSTSRRDMIQTVIECILSSSLHISTDNMYIASHIPDNIEKLKGKFEMDDHNVNKLLEHKMKELNGINVFSKILNLIYNSCVRKLCNKTKDKSPAYYFAEYYIKTYVYGKTHSIV